MKNIFIILLGVILISSCGVTKKAQRKLRRADRLMKEAGYLAPQLFDTLYIVKTDTVVLNKDSLIFETKLLLDTIKVDSIIEKLILVKQQGGDIRGLKQEIYDELLPDLHYNSRDSLKVVIDEKVHFVRFDMTIVIENDKLVVTAKPVDNVPFVSVRQEINIDAVRKRFYEDWLFWLLVGIFAAFMIFKEALMTWIKSIT